jgi:hypothetical protein
MRILFVKIQFMQYFFISMFLAIIKKSETTSVRRKRLVVCESTFYDSTIENIASKQPFKDSRELNWKGIILRLK